MIVYVYEKNPVSFDNKFVYRSATEDGVCPIPLYAAPVAFNSTVEKSNNKASSSDMPVMV